MPDGDGAIEQAIDLDVDLMLMDIRLAGRMDGIEAARRIREQRDTPIIFITAHGDPATRAHIERVHAGRAGAGQADHRRPPARGDRLGVQGARLTLRGQRSVSSPPPAPARRCR